jgi:outer membrane usher protein FimD/PapC
MNEVVFCLKARRASRRTAVACAVLGLACAQAQSQDQSQDPGTAPGAPVQVAQFDEQILKDRGLSPSIGQYFRYAARFTPGDTIVQVTVNGNALGRKTATFDSAGQLCLTPAFVRAIGLRPMTEPASATVSAPCASYARFSPRTVVTLDPGSSAVDITTPSENIAPGNAASENLQGGTGALLNYRVFSLDNRFGGSSNVSTFQQLDSTLGFNAQDWIFRSNQTYVKTNGIANLRWQSAYGQKTFVDARQIFQVGRTTIQNPLYGGVPLIGAQWFPETALTAQNQFAVTGVAFSRARVEIRQAGTLLYSTVVPPGPFSLSDFNLSNRSVDLQVKVIEEGGAEKNTIVPATSLMLSNTTVTPGLSVSAGQLWDAGDNSEFGRRVGVVAAAQGWSYKDGKIAGVVGTLLSSNYLSTGVSLSTRPWGPSYALFAQLLATRDSKLNKSGVLASTGLSLALSDTLGLGLTGNMRSEGYRSVQEAKSMFQRNGLDFGYHTQTGADVRWSAGTLGALYANVTRQTYFVGPNGYTTTLGWSGAWRSVLVAVGISHNTSRTILDVPNSPGSAGSSNYAFVNVTVPLGGNATSTTFTRSTNGTTRSGTGVDQRVNETFAYRATVEKVAGQSDSTNTNLSAYVQPRYTSLTFGAGQGQGYSSYYAEASGSVIATQDGVALSPYPVRDTFGTLKLNDALAPEGQGAVSGVRVETPQGPVWTGPNGLASIPAVQSYFPTRLEVDTGTLSTDVDISDGLQVFQAGRGAVISARMAAVRVHRVLLSVKLANGNNLPAGSPIVRGTDEFFTSSAENGRVLMSNLKEGESYSAHLADGSACVLRDISITPKQDGDYFERGTARCQ